MGGKKRDGVIHFPYRFLVIFECTPPLGLPVLLSLLPFLFAIYLLGNIISVSLSAYFLLTCADTNIFPN